MDNYDLARKGPFTVQVGVREGLQHEFSTVNVNLDTLGATIAVAINYVDVKAKTPVIIYSDNAWYWDYERNDWSETVPIRQAMSNSQLWWTECASATESKGAGPVF